MENNTIKTENGYETNTTIAHVYPCTLNTALMCQIVAIRQAHPDAKINKYTELLPMYTSNEIFIAVKKLLDPVYKGTPAILDLDILDIFT